MDDILKNSQRDFYALRIKNYPRELNFSHQSNLEKRSLVQAQEEYPVQILAGTYIPEEHRVRDSGFSPGPKILTFAQILKYNIFPLPQLLSDFLDIARKAMGCPVEIEFSGNLSPDKKRKSNFYFLQMRPMVAGGLQMEIDITPEESERAVCRSSYALGNGRFNNILDTRIKLYFGNEAIYNDISEIPPPALNEDSFYGKLITQYQMNVNERLTHSE